MSKEQNDLAESTAANQAYGGEVVTETPATTPESVAEVQPKMAEITEDEYQALVARAALIDEIKAETSKKFDTAFGTIGNLKQSLERMQTQRSGPIEVTVDDFPELQADYPDLADKFVKSLPAVLARIPVGQSAPSNDIEAIRKDLIDSHLDGIVGGDWIAAVRSDDFAEWRKTWGDEPDKPSEQTKLAHSNSPRDSASLLRQFQAYRARPKTAPATAPAVTTRQRQIQAAVPPKSTQSTGGSQPKTELDYARDAYNNA